MENVAFKVEEGKLVVTVDLGVPGQPSSSGKTTLLASTRGNVQVNPGVYLGLNVYRKQGK